MQKLYTPTDSPMRLAAFMSGSGTTLERTLEHQTVLMKNGGSPFDIVKIFTDNANENNRAMEIGERYCIPVQTDMLKAFYALKRKDPKDLGARQEYFESIATDLIQYKVDGIALMGYMAIITEPILSLFNGRILNHHPSDLSIRNADGKAKYTGDHAVAAAILDGQKEIRASTHLVVCQVDQGGILMVSEPLPVHLPDGFTAEKLARPENKNILREVEKGHQDKLKRIGDWKIVPLTIELIAKGAFEIGASGVIHLNGRPIPNGSKIETASII